MVIRRFHMELAMAGLTGLVGLVVATGSLELGIGWGDSGPESGYFPFYIGILLVLASVGNAASALIFKRHDGEIFVEREQVERLAGFFVPMALFVVVTIFLGLYVGTALYLFYVAWRHGKYHPLLAIAIGIGFAVFLYGVFELLFEVPLLKGPLEHAFGIY